jgi:hypothetical protein
MESKIRDLIVPLSERLIKQLTSSLEAAKADHLTLMAVEVLVANLIASFALELLSGLLAILFHHTKTSVVCCPQCQKKMPVQGYMSRSVISLFGRFSYRRAFYYCRACKQRRTPFDEQLALGERLCSPRLQRIVAFLAAHLSFSTVSATLRECLQVEVSSEAVRQISEEVGHQCQDWEQKQRQSYEQQEIEKRPPSQTPKTWVIEADGKLVGFQEGGWQEVKVGVIYDVADRVEPSTGRKELLKREVVARRCGWQEFSKDFWAAMRRAGVKDGDRLVAVADGAHSMEQIFAFVAPEALRIRDFYHVAERIQAIAEVRFGEGTAEGKGWAKAQLHKLKESEVEKVMRSIAHLKIETKTGEETRRQVLGYLHNHSEAMDYRSYREEGLPIGSGAVEGGCRLIGARTNGCGRRWGETGCDAIVALRVTVLNDRLDQIRPLPQLALNLAA